jgi:hypothetical protein
MTADIVIAWPAQWSLGHVAVLIVVIAAVVALVIVAFRQFGVSIPQWVQQVFWILAVAFVVIAAIRLVLGM